MMSYNVELYGYMILLYHKMFVFTSALNLFVTNVLLIGLYDLIVRDTNKSLISENNYL